MPVSTSLIQVADQITDVYFRLNNLYTCVNEAGDVVPFRMNDAQVRIFNDLWYRTIIPKARQMGVTTLTTIIALDYALFNDNRTVGIIAHRADSAKKIYRDKILAVYDRLPAAIRNSRPTIQRQDSGGFVSFANGSSITVDLSFRSTTCQLLIISELAKISALYPARATEIKAGSFPTVHGKKGRIIIESTAETAFGLFFELCMTAQDNQLQRKDLNPYDWRLQFLPWDIDDRNVLTDHDSSNVVITPKDDEYFDRVESKTGRTLSQNQRAWYITTRATLGDLTKQEYPAFLEEAFEQVIEGAYYESQIRNARKDGRIGDFPAIDGVPVRTVIDIGIADETCIWMWQELPGEFRFVDCYMASGEGMGHYFDYMKDTGFTFEQHIAPADIAVREWTSGQSRIEVAAKEYGIQFTTAPRMSVADGIDAVRRMFSRCTFNEATCKDGINALSSYRKEWDEKRGCYKNKPRHDFASHPSDSLRYMAITRGHLADVQEEQDRPTQPPSSNSIWENVGV